MDWMRLWTVNRGLRHPDYFVQHSQVRRLLV
jgi:hypothetical protein